MLNSNGPKNSLLAEHKICICRDIDLIDTAHISKISFKLFTKLYSKALTF